jgi:serine---pyruvate transaminase
MTHATTKLYTPGPVHVPATLLAAIASRNVHHRTSEFYDLFESIREYLKTLFAARNEVLTFVCSGTGGMECAVANSVEAGDRVLVVRGGKFSARWADICKAYGAQVVTVDHPLGTAVDCNVVEDALRRNKGCKTAFFTHCETSTGVLNDIRTLSEAAARHGAFVVVDAISSIIAEPFFMDEWGIDLAVCASHKGLQLPPGLAFVCASERLLERMRSIKERRAFYFDVLRAHAYQLRGQTPFTPSTHLMVGLHESLSSLMVEGMEARWSYFREYTEIVRDAALGLNLEIFNQQNYSHALTVVRVPESLQLANFSEMLATYGFRLGGGQDELRGKVLRISHLGGTSREDTRQLFAAMGECLARCRNIGVANSAA